MVPDNSKRKQTVSTPDGSNRVLLHSCCAPCSCAIIDCLITSGIEPIIYYYNPNIYPDDEYVLRKSENLRYAKALDLTFIDAEHDYSHWRREMQGLEQEPERGSRCQKCFALRLAHSARYAHEHGISVLSTTLASSAWKDLNQINLAGRKAVQPYSDVIFWEYNWRKNGLSELRAHITKEYGFYRQQYCGCEFSLRDSIEWRKRKQSADMLRK